MTTAWDILIAEIAVVIAVGLAIIIEQTVPGRWRSAASVVFFAAGIVMFLIYAVLAMLVTGNSY